MKWVMGERGLLERGVRSIPVEIKNKTRGKRGGKAEPRIGISHRAQGRGR